MVIYALSDPRNKTVPKYVGRTIKPLRQRLSGHRCVAKRYPHYPVSKWVTELKSIGLIPVIYALEVVTGENGKERETHWIRFFKPLGLLNRSDGDGRLGNPMSEQELTEFHKSDNFITNQVKLKEANRKRMKRVIGDDGTTFNSVAEAYKTLKVSEWGLRDCIKHHWRVKGIYWRIEA